MVRYLFWKIPPFVAVPIYIIPAQFLQSYFLISSLVLPFCLCLGFPSGYLHLDGHQTVCCKEYYSIIYMQHKKLVRCSQKNGKLMLGSEVTINLFMYFKDQNILNVNRTAQDIVMLLFP